MSARRALPMKIARISIIDRAWLERWAHLLGLSVWELVGVDGICEIDLIPYQVPTDEDFPA